MILGQSSTATNGINGQGGPSTKGGSGFFRSVCAYFRDFLDTDFRRQRTPKRSIELKDQRGNLLSISLEKYPALVADLWKALSANGTSPKPFSLSVARGKYRTRMNRTLLDLVERHVSTINPDVLLTLGDGVRANSRELRAKFSSDPERYADAILTNVRNGLVRTTVSPLLAALEASLEGRSGQLRSVL